jgi:hypothetical protein
MASALTEHVRNFGAASDPTGQVLPALERLLRYRMRQKNLLSASPGFLGYTDVPSWAAPNAFEDIVADCYIYAIVQRVAALRNQLKIKPNVDGLISRNVKNFLLERQQRYDPIGYAVFGNVKGAAREAAMAGVILLENLERGKIHNETVLRFVGGRPGASPAPPELIHDAVKETTGWEQVMRHPTKTTEEAREWVLGFVQQLRRAGVAAIRCGDLVAAVAGRVRADWAARHADPAAELGQEGEDEYAATVRMVWPDEGLEARERWEKLKRVIQDRIARLDRQERVRARLAGVFAALVRAVEEGGPAPPTQAELVERTGVARATLSDDFRLLKEIITGLDAQNPDT